jgi:hypothetical protein
MQYRVACYFGRGADQACAQFKALTDAQLFIENKMAQDAQMKLTVIYRLYDLGELVKEYDPGKGVPASGKPQEQQAQGSQGKGSTASFRPTPFNTAPRPTGTPQRWLINPEDEDNKDGKK